MSSRRPVAASQCAASARACRTASGSPWKSGGVLRSAQRSSPTTSTATAAAAKTTVSGGRNRPKSTSAVATSVEKNGSAKIKCREYGDDENARNRKHDGDRAQRSQSSVEVHDNPGEHEVQRRAAALGDHRVEH